MKSSVALAAAAICSFIPTSLAAHSHSIQKNGQVLANGANHPAFTQDLSTGEWSSCDTNTLLPNFGEAWYGLETAHHGPDASDSGKDDGCYMIEGGLSPLNPLSDRNPAIQ